MKFLILILLLFWNCQTTRKPLQVYPEPILEKMHISSDEFCLERRFFFFPKKPCVSLIYEKENQSGEMHYYIQYNVGNFDVDVPLGVSLMMDGVYYNIRKASTEYAESILVLSELPEDLIPKLESTKQLSISYSNRRNTDFHTMSSSHLAELQNQSKSLKEKLNQSGKMQIKKKY